MEVVSTKEAVNDYEKVFNVISFVFGHYFIRIITFQYLESIRILKHFKVSHFFQDYDFLYKSGASAIFGPGTKLPVAALEVVNLISGHLDRQKYAEKN